MSVRQNLITLLRTCLFFDRGDLYERREKMGEKIDAAMKGGYRWTGLIGYGFLGLILPTIVTPTTFSIPFVRVCLLVVLVFIALWHYDKGAIDQFIAFFLALLIGSFIGVEILGLLNEHFQASQQKWIQWIYKFVSPAT